MPARDSGVQLRVLADTIRTGLNVRAAVGPQPRSKHPPPSERHRTTCSIQEPHVSVSGAGEPLVGGRLMSEITNRIVAFMREHYGRGPIKAKT